MPAQRAFDPNKLKSLLEVNPTASLPELAEALTRDNEVHGVPRTVSTHLVSAAISRFRDQWAADGVKLWERRSRSEYVSRLIKNAGRSIPARYSMNHLLLMLRTLDRIKYGLPVDNEKRERDALAFERRCLNEGLVVDLDPETGRPFQRPASPWERDAKEGRIIDLVTAGSTR